MVSKVTLISRSGVDIPIALQRFVLDGLAENSKNSVIGSHAELTIRGYGVIQGGAQRLLLFGLHFPPPFPESANYTIGAWSEVRRQTAAGGVAKWKVTLARLRVA